VASVSRRPLAALDILDIWDHIADDSMTAADRWIDELDKAFGTLATQPKMGRARPELAPVNAGQEPRLCDGEVAVLMHG